MQSQQKFIHNLWNDKNSKKKKKNEGGMKGMKPTTQIV